MRVERLVVFLKAPRPGAVKTRLAQTLGADAACAAYLELVGTLLNHLAPLPHLELRFTPDDARGEIHPWLRADWRAQPQRGGDLGERLSLAFSENFADGARRVIIIGSDCPAIEIADIEQAWSALHKHDLVLGPATDGGYWLIGLRAAQPALFAKMEWSTEKVFAETLTRANAAKLCIHLLRELTDVDTEADWRAWKG